MFIAISRHRSELIESFILIYHFFIRVRELCKSEKFEPSVRKPDGPIERLEMKIGSPNGFTEQAASLLRRVRNGRENLFDVSVIILVVRA